MHRPHIETRTKASERGEVTLLAIFGWIAFAVVSGFVVLVLYKTYAFYGLMRSGQLVELPQFEGRLTAIAGAPNVSASVVDPAVAAGTEQPSIGADGAALTIVEFADFECPFSQEAHAVVRRLAAKYGDRVKFVYRDFPITQIHSRAYDASLAAECADEQGKFWPYHDKLYANSQSLGFDDLVSYSAEVGMDERQFEKCLTDRRYDADVAEDIAVAERLSLRGTPTFFFNGYRVDGSIPEAEFEKIIERILK
jgi:protein-disulfide isomerase